MRKIFLSTLAAATSVIVLHAEGYQLNLNSVKQAGMGNAAVALKLGAESMVYNPAGLSFINGRMHFSGGLTAIRSSVSYTHDGYKAKTDNPVSTPLFFYAGVRITDNLAAGVSLNNPAGNSIYWPDHWRGAAIVQSSSLKAFSLQPSLSYKFWNDRLSVGAGLMIVWGDFHTARALIPVNGLATIGQVLPQYKPLLDQYADRVPVSAKLYGDARVNVGFNAGLLFTPHPKVSIGLSYRSKVNMKVTDGHTDLNYASTEIQQLIAGLPAALGVVIPPLDQSVFSASMPVPANVNAGVAYQPCEKLLLSAELQWVGWGAFKKLVVQYDQKAGNYASTVFKGYANTMIYRMGGQYTFCPAFDVRLGFYYDTTPVSKSLYYSPETPGSNKSAFTCGFSYRPFGGFSIDAAFTYSSGAKTTGSFFESPDSSTLFTGTYKAYALLPAFGISYRF